MCDHGPSRGSLRSQWPAGDIHCSQWLQFDSHPGERSCPRGCFVPAGDGGVALDGGAVEFPAGGTILDGDYELITWQAVAAGSCDSTFPTAPTAGRRIRVFGGGTYFEWAQVDITQEEIDGWWDATSSTTGASLALSLTCGGGVTLPGSIAFTATGNDLILFFYVGGNDDGQALRFVVSYRRTCAR